MIISRRAMKVFLLGAVLATSANGVRGIGDEEIESAVKVATVSLQREMTSLKEQLELFELKQETLQAASEQFRMQSKSAKTKLEEERKRFDILALEKESLEASIESKLKVALENQRVAFEANVAAELMEKKKLLAKENADLVQKLRKTELHIEMLEGDWKEKLEQQARRFQIDEGKRVATEEKLRTAATDLKKRLAFSEKQAKSFEESLNNAMAEAEENDEFFQKESKKRLDEASRWENKIQKLIKESKDLHKDNKAKEVELVRSKKLHLTLLEKLSESDEAVREHEEKILKFTADIKSLSNDLSATSGELAKSKKEREILSMKFENLSDLYHDTKSMLDKAGAEEKKTIIKNKQLENKLVDLQLELESNDKKTKQTIEEKSQMTKTFNEALKQLTSKNTFLRHELVDLKFELEQSQSETDTLKTEAAQITNAHKNAVEQLESEGKTLKSLQKEYSNLKKEFETISDQFKESEAKVKQYQKRIEEEAAVNEELQKELLHSELKVENGQKTEQELNEESQEILKMYEAIQETMGASEKKLLETMQQYEKSEAQVEKLQGSVRNLEERVEELLDELEMKELKNSVLQKSLLETKLDLEESQNKVSSLEGGSSSTQDTTEKQKMMERVRKLELELQESNQSYDAASRKIDDLRKQLNATQTRSAEILTLYEDMKEENDALTIDDKNEIQIENIDASTTEDAIVDSDDIVQQESPKRSFFQWALYSILRVVVDSFGFVARALWQMLSSSSTFVRVVAPFQSLFAVALWAFDEYSVVHDALVSLFEFEMTFISSLVSGEQDSSFFMFLINNSEMLVSIGEGFAFLLGIDFVVSSLLLNPIQQTQKRSRPKTKTIHVPESANASLLRKANNM